MEIYKDQTNKQTNKQTHATYYISDRALELCLPGG
jgi:hypothetical protein